MTDGTRDELTVSLSDFAILCRTRDHFGVVAKALRDHNLPYQEVGTIPFFREEPFKSYIGMLGILSSAECGTAAAIMKMKGNDISGMRFREVAGRYA